MRLQSLKSKLLLAVSALVIGSGLLISLLVTQRYSNSLLDAASVQAENIAHAVALEAADKILINDLVALQKMLDHHMRSNPLLSYLFIVKSEEILAHTFTKGVPVALINANQPHPDKQFTLQNRNTVKVRNTWTLPGLSSLEKQELYASVFQKNRTWNRYADCGCR